jgi:hypothetical protein
MLATVHVHAVLKWLRKIFIINGVIDIRTKRSRTLLWYRQIKRLSTESMINSFTLGVSGVDDFGVPMAEILQRA